MTKLSADLSSVTSVGLDLAKQVFQVHAVDAEGRVMVARALRRRELLPFFAALPRCVVGMEVCGSAYHGGARGPPSRSSACRDLQRSSS